MESGDYVKMGVFDLPSAKMEHVQTKSGRCRGDHTRPKKNAQDCYFFLTETTPFHHQRFGRFSKAIFCCIFKGC
jgi:hypothetical protein